MDEASRGEGKTEVEAAVGLCSGEAQAEVDVHGAGGVGDGAGGDELSAGFGVGADGLEEIGRAHV